MRCKKMKARKAEEEDKLPGLNHSVKESERIKKKRTNNIQISPRRQCSTSDERRLLMGCAGISTAATSSSPSADMEVAASAAHTGEPQLAGKKIHAQREGAPVCARARPLTQEIKGR